MAKISYGRSLEMGCQYIDTRSPGEFAADHIPGAVNIPILDNEERALVGTIYSKIGKKEALSKGKVIFQKKIDLIKKELAGMEGEKLVVYCWRGGMRSKTITELAGQLGHAVFQLDSGYKSYRRYVRERLEKFDLKPKLIVLHGLTGSGKTEILKHFRDSLDLEDIAKHRSSVFGAIGLTPSTQKMFESILFKELSEKNDRDYLLIEGESRRIGNSIMPYFLNKAMRKGINIRVECSFKSRIRRSKETYLGDDSHWETVKSIVLSLKNRLGKRTTEELLKLMDNHDKDKFVEQLLLKYYDPLYEYSIDNIDYEHRINSDFLDRAVISLKSTYGLS